MCRSIATMACCFVLSGFTHAGEEGPPNFAEDTLTGDWGGTRTAAARRGFLFDDRLAVLAGLYPIDSEFFTVDSAGVFIGPQQGTR